MYRATDLPELQRFCRSLREDNRPIAECMRRGAALGTGVTDGSNLLLTGRELADVMLKHSD